MFLIKVQLDFFNENFVFKQLSTFKNSSLFYQHSQFTHKEKLTNAIIRELTMNCVPKRN